MNRVVIRVDPTSCRPRSRSSTNERTSWVRAGSPPTRRRCGSTPISGSAGSGQSRAPWAWVARWHSDCWRPASVWSMSPPSSQPGRVCSTPATGARPTLTMRTRWPWLPSAREGPARLALDGQLEALRMLVDHRDQLSNQRVATVNRLHRLLAELTPGQAKKDIILLDRHQVGQLVRGDAAPGLAGDVARTNIGQDRFRLQRGRMEAMRCLKRRISDAVYRQLVADAQRVHGTGPGGHCGASQESSAAGSHPPTGTSDQPLPGPAETTRQPSPRPRKPEVKQPLKRAG